MFDFLAKLSGEVALPGGKVDEGDADAKATALREAKEEIGLDPALVSVVAILEPFLSKVIVSPD
jgi:peroxisomal coenzyme A diphosphatase NUDT7